MTDVKNQAQKNVSETVGVTTPLATSTTADPNKDGLAAIQRQLEALQRSNVELKAMILELKNAIPAAAGGQ